MKCRSKLMFRYSLSFNSFFLGNRPRVPGGIKLVNSDYHLASEINAFATLGQGLQAYRLLPVPCLIKDIHLPSRDM